MKKILGAVAVLGLIATACFGGSNSSSSPPPSVGGSISHQPVTLSIWSLYSGREFEQYNQVLSMFKQQYPWISINSVPGKGDPSIFQAINAGNPPDLALSFGPDNVARFCSTGALQNLNPYLQSDGIDISSVSPPQALALTSYKGDQCELPVLSDAYGLYYNTAMFKAAGIKSPPQTMSQLAADAIKLTQQNPDGSFKVLGFDPLSGFYENPSLFLGQNYGAQWYQSDGKSAFATDPQWTSLLDWQKSLIDKFGYENLLKFGQTFNPDTEWSAQQAFETGHLAMTIDGEWREAFIQSDKSNVPYQTAPFPTANNQTSLYGSGVIGGDVIGIPRGAQHPADAWLLLKYLATNTQAEEALAEKLRNVPTTYQSLKDPVLNQDPIFKVFLNIFANKNSGFKPLTTIGSADEDLWGSFLEKWEAGKVPNLQAGLQQLASQIDAQSQLG